MTSYALHRMDETEDEYIEKELKAIREIKEANDKAEAIRKRIYSFIDSPLRTMK